MAKVGVTFRLEQKLVDALDDLAERLNMTRTEIAERALIAGVKEGRQTVQRLENPLIRGVIETMLSLDPSVSADDKAEFQKVVDRVIQAGVAAKKGKKA